MQREIAALFRRLTNGVYVVGVAQGDRRNAFTAAWVMQVSFQPPLLALAIHPGHASYPLLVLVRSRHPAGDHELVIGQVVDGAVLRPDAAPMTYAETGDLDGSEELYPDTMSGWTDGRMRG